MRINAALAGLAVLGSLSFGAIIDSGNAPWTCLATNPTPCVGNVPVNLGAGSGPWVGATGGSQWIGPDAASVPTADASGWSLPGQYIYELRFSSLGGTFFEYSQLRMAADNSAVVQFCDDANTCTTIHTQAGPMGFATVSTIAAGVVPVGSTKLRVVVNNEYLDGIAEGRSPTGFFLEGDLETPEPTALSMLGLGLAGVWVARKRFVR